MFRTQDDDQIGIPGMFGQGVAQWHTVTRLIKTHWYHLTIRSEEDGRSFELSQMLEGERKLQHMLVSQDADIAITEILVVTPGWMNNKGRWHMESVTKVTVGQDHQGCEISLIEVESGATYHTSHSPGFSSNLLTNLRPIFLPGMIRSA